MSPTQRTRLFKLTKMIVALLAGVGLILYAFSNNINLFYTPSELLKETALPNKVIRLGGMVVEGSVEYSDNLSVKFVLTDYEDNITVYYTGILPDLFKEGQGIVALGKINDSKVFNATQVLAKHDENYMPPELSSISKSTT
ncbi:MAG: cytochrome c maturation protein CcmE [Legionellales bacterium]|nr:cytochrome c maturation protein CcmE [Legionellales bacterium]